LLHLVGDLFELSKNIYWITMYHSQPWKHHTNFSIVR
jgi:hypothetical protein